MIACVDVAYSDSKASAACLLFTSWEDTAPQSELVRSVEDVAPYQPGEFYRRELPCILAVLELAPAAPSPIVVDGYVWLNAEKRPGLGAHLYEALGRETPVIGVAKSPFFRGPLVAELLRGESTRPLFVTSAGISLDEAATCIRRMHGEFRIPTLLKRADELARNS